MEFLRKLFVQTQSHLKGLTASQRLAIGSCAGLIVLALLWLVNWSGSQTMVPLLDQPMSADEIAPIRQRLEAMQITHKVQNGVLLVPADQEYQVRAQLAQAQALPRDISLGFTRLIEKNMSPWQDLTEKDWLRGVALGNELARTLQCFEGIEDARVFLDRTVKRTIGQPPVVPTASVFVKPAAGVQLTRDRVFAMANMVSAAVGGLDVTKVRVADMTTGRSYAVPSLEDTLAFSDLEDRQKKETYFANKIRDLFDIPGLLVAVHAALDEESTQVIKEEHGKPVMVADESESETMARGQQADEPGVNPNTSVAISSGGNSENMEKNRTKSTFDGRVDRTVTKTEKPRHGIQKLFASVNVPRSYLEAIYKKANEGKVPTDEELNALARTELDVKIRNQVLGVLGLGRGEEDQVKVAWIHDDATIQLGEAMQAGTTDGMLALVRVYGGKAGLGALAFVSLVMMLMMVRRVSEGPVLPGEEPPARQVIHIKGRRKADEVMEMTVGDEPVGDAEVSGALLVGREVDEHTLHSQEVVGQVVEMINDDPETTVGILRRWMDTDQK